MSHMSKLRTRKRTDRLRGESRRQRAATSKITRDEESMKRRGRDDEKRARETGAST